MPKITKFDRSTAHSTAMNAVLELKRFAEDRGLTVDYRGGKFGGTKFTMRLEFNVTATGSLEEVERNDFTAYCALYGLTPAHYGTTIVVSGKQLELVGFAPSRRKFPLKFREKGTPTVRLYTEVLADRVRAIHAASVAS